MEKKIKYTKLVFKSLAKSLGLLLFVYYAFFATLMLEMGFNRFDSPAVSLNHPLTMPFEYFFSYPEMLISLTGPSIMFYGFGIVFFVRELVKK